MFYEAILAFEPFRTFNTVKSTKTRKIFLWFSSLMLGQVLRRAEVGMNFVEISAVQSEAALCSSQ